MTCVKLFIVTGQSSYDITIIFAGLHNIEKCYYYAIYFEKKRNTAAEFVITDFVNSDISTEIGKLLDTNFTIVSINTSSINLITLSMISNKRTQLSAALFYNSRDSSRGWIVQWRTTVRFLRLHGLDTKRLRSVRHQWERFVLKCNEILTRKCCMAPKLWRLHKIFTFYLYPRPLWNGNGMIACFCTISGLVRDSTRFVGIKS